MWAKIKSLFSGKKPPVVITEEPKSPVMFIYPEAVPKKSRQPRPDFIVEMRRDWLREQFRVWTDNNRVLFG
jgi:hypothetical protein